MGTIALMEPASRGEHRRYARQPYDLVAEAIVWQRCRAKRYPARIRDVSPDGVGMEIRYSLPPVSKKPVTVYWNIPAAVSGAGTDTYTKMTGMLVHNGVPGKCGIRFNRLISEQVAMEKERWKKAAALVAIAFLAVTVIFLKTRNVVSFWYSPLIQVYSLAVAVFVLSRIALSFTYAPPEDKRVLKKVSIVISVKNEEAHIEETVRQCFRFHYPSPLLQVIVIDDGSTDTTWQKLVTLRAAFPRLKLLRFRENRGKRHGMALGVKKASGEIIVFMDSDVVVDAEGLYRIVQPFHDQAVGAVAGHTQVIVQPDNIISKMESVRYFVSQRVMKAAESVFGAVTCCPGPFSAYRRSAIMEVLDEWLNQKFFGTRATFGDDRSLTNFMLRKYKVVYHSAARCSTYVPETWQQFIRQQLRWKKSWIRETTVAVKLMYREHVAAAFAYYLGVVISLVSPLILLRAFAYEPLLMANHAYLHYVGGLFMLFLLLGLIYFYHTRSRYWYYGLLFAVIYSWFFSLQTYYAMLTVRKNHWGTR